MLDLDPAVQLQEPELAAREHELGRARARVADRACERDRRRAHLGPQLRVERRRRGLLEHLLVAPLHRAVALAEREHGAVGVGEDLDLDVAGPLDVALAEDGAVAERRLCLARRGRERLFELLRLAHDPHPAPAAAGRRLDEQRIAERGRLAGGHHRDARLGGDPLRRQLVAAQPEGFGRRADPRQARCHDRLGEVGVLGEEAVAGMDRVRA